MQEMKHSVNLKKRLEDRHVSNFFWTHFLKDIAVTSFALKSKKKVVDSFPVIYIVKILKLWIVNLMEKIEHFLTKKVDSDKREGLT